MNNEILSKWRTHYNCLLHFSYCCIQIMWCTREHVMSQTPYIWGHTRQKAVRAQMLVVGLSNGPRPQLEKRNCIKHWVLSRTRKQWKSMMQTFFNWKHDVPITSREAMFIPHREAMVNASKPWSNLPSLWPLTTAREDNMCPKLSCNRLYSRV